MRNPLETIPSRLSLVQAVQELQTHDHAGLSRSEIDEIVADSVRTYLLADRDIKALPSLDGHHHPLRRSCRRRPGRHGGPDLRAARPARRAATRCSSSAEDGAGAGLARLLASRSSAVAEAELRLKLAPIFARYGYRRNASARLSRQEAALSQNDLAAALGRVEPHEPKLGKRLFEPLAAGADLAQKRAVRRQVISHIRPEGGARFRGRPRPAARAPTGSCRNSAASAAIASAST